MHVPLYLPVSNIDQRPETGGPPAWPKRRFMLKQNMPKLSEISERFAVPKKHFFTSLQVQSSKGPHKLGRQGPHEYASRGRRNATPG